MLCMRRAPHISASSCLSPRPVLGARYIPVVLKSKQNRNPWFLAPTLGPASSAPLSVFRPHEAPNVGSTSDTAETWTPTELRQKFGCTSAEEWQGCWCQYSPSGKLQKETLSERKFEHFDDPARCILHTNSFSSSSWNPSGRTQQEWVYAESSLRSKTLLKGKLTWVWFGPSGILNVAENGAVFAVELFFYHPDRPKVRLSVIPFWQQTCDGRLELRWVSYCREHEGVGHLAWPGTEADGRFWDAEDQTTRRVDEKIARRLLAPVHKQRWKLVDTEILHESGEEASFAEREEAGISAVVPAGVSEAGHATMQLPGGMLLTVPLLVGPARVGQETTLVMRWRAEAGLLLGAQVQYGADGAFRRLESFTLRAAEDPEL